MTAKPLPRVAGPIKRKHAVESRNLEFPRANTDRQVKMTMPDCGMKYLPRDVAFGKLQAMAQGAAIVRAELDR